MFAKLLIIGCLSSIQSILVLSENKEEFASVETSVNGDATNFYQGFSRRLGGIEKFGFFGRKYSRPYRDLSSENGGYDYFVNAAYGRRVLAGEGESSNPEDNWATVDGKDVILGCLKGECGLFVTQRSLVEALGTDIEDTNPNFDELNRDLFKLPMDSLHRDCYPDEPPSGCDYLLTITNDVILDLPSDTVLTSCTNDGCSAYVDPDALDKAIEDAALEAVTELSDEIENEPDNESENESENEPEQAGYTTAQAVAEAAGLDGAENLESPLSGLSDDEITLLLKWVLAELARRE